MKVDLQNASIRITSEQPLPLNDARGVAIMVMWGDVWLTQEGDSEDYVLRAGDTKRVDRNGLTLLQALDDAAVSLLREGGTEHLEWMSEDAVRIAPPIPYY